MTSANPAPQLYLISPPLREASAFVPVLAAALADIKAACLFLDIVPQAQADAKAIVRALAPVAQGQGCAVLTPDPSYVARAGADGVHILASGETMAEDIERAIESMKPERIVGVGGLRSRHEAMVAGELGVDYVMFGDPLKGGTAPSLQETIDRISWWAEIFTPPCVAFAAALDDAAQLAAAGADFIAVGSAFWTDPRGAAHILRSVVSEDATTRSAPR